MDPPRREAELRTRIEEISSAITLQMQILKDLQIQKCDLQRDLNAIRDPIARVPFELTSKIFLLCLTANATPRADAAPTALFNVSRIWRSIALGIPALWSSIRISRPHRNFGRLIETWLPHSQSRTLSLSFRDSWDDKWAKRFIKKYAHRIENLDVFSFAARQLKQITASFRPQQVAPLSSLTKLTLRSPEGNLCHCIKILRAAPYLVECRFLGFEYCTVVEEEQLTLAHLECLRLGTVHPDDECTSRILLNLTLPALKKLVVSYFDIPFMAFLSFINRSAPPLQYLHVGSPWPHDPTRTLELEDVYPSLQLRANNLTELSVCVVPYRRPSDEFTILAADTKLLPNLATVTIYGEPHPSAWQLILVALRARRRSLKTFRLKFYDGDEPSSDVLEALRELVLDGMHIDGLVV